ncbi:UNVERIFIED_CONTAM: hypothetical protein FKN15_052511 [Acipenser sinensis]
MPLFLILCYLAMARPRPVVVSGPSGAGKSTLLKRLLREYEGVFGFSVSHLYSGPLSSAVTFPQTHYCPDPSSQFGSLPFNTRPPFLDPSFSGASPFSIAEVHQELQMLQRQLGESESL